MDAERLREVLYEVLFALTGVELAGKLVSGSVEVLEAIPDHYDEESARIVVVSALLGRIADDEFGQSVGRVIDLVREALAALEAAAAEPASHPAVEPNGGPIQ